jgi:hypothetical protein
MIALATTVTLPSPILLDLRIATAPRPRVVPDGEASEGMGKLPPTTQWHEFSEFPLQLQVNGYARTISAYLPPIPAPLELYGPEDFAAAAADTMEDHAARALHLLGTDPASLLQALIDGSDLPPRPPRIPRSIRAWQARAVLREMGLLEKVQTLIAQLADPDVTEAWEARENLARHGKTVLGVSAALGLTPTQVDALFVAAGAKEV